LSRTQRLPKLMTWNKGLFYSIVVGVSCRREDDDVAALADDEQKVHEWRVWWLLH